MRQSISIIGLVFCGNRNKVPCKNIRDNSERLYPSAAATALNFDPNWQTFNDSFSLAPIIRHRSGLLASSTQINSSVSSTMACLFAGSVGGAVGVGIAYPFDTLSTKAQINARKEDCCLTFWQNFLRIWRNEGVSGFFEGVLATMVGQAIIKAIQFATNEFTFLWLEKNSSIQSNVIKMATAGVISGLISSFVVSPVELVKVRMQSQNKLTLKKEGSSSYNCSKSDYLSSREYKNELDCAKWVVKNEGWAALLCHGLGITIIREIPSFAIYFGVYGLLAKSSMASLLGGHAAPLIFGAIAGWAMWIPTYPIDIVKTIVQVQTPMEGEILEKRKLTLSSRQIVGKLYHSGGLPAFFEGLEPKLVRAAIKHAVTFWVYEILMNTLQPKI